jgi:hypothetical protein
MLNDQRELANLLADSALYEHLTGNDYDSLETIRDIFAQADAISRQPILVSHLVANGINALAISRLELISPGLRLADDPSRPIQPITPAQRKQVQSLIAILIDPAISNQTRYTFEGERMMQLDTILWMSSHSVLRPLYLRDVSQSLDLNSRMMAASTQPTLAAAMQIASPMPPKTATISHISLLSSLIPSYTRFMTTEYRIRAERQMVAVALAARLYQIDHHGQWPAKLEDLVPHYLPSVPIDPLSSTGKPLGYLLANHGIRPMVHSAGDSGIDLALRESAVPGWPQHGWSTTTSDQWRDISRFSPPPTTRSSDE